MMVSYDGEGRKTSHSVSSQANWGQSKLVVNFIHKAAT